MTLKMLQTDTFFKDSKNITQLAIAVSLAAHIGAIVLVKTIKFSQTVIPAVVENYIDLGYEQFDEVPQIVEANVPVVKDNSEVIPDKSEPAPAAQEMQDQSSDIAGTTKEVTKEVAPRAVTGNVTSVPYYKIKPKYPKEALLSGIEGHITLTIDIKEDGSVENIKITGGDKVSVFESEARRAVAKWKYKPFTDASGAPIKKDGYAVRVDFKLADETASN